MLPLVTEVFSLVWRDASADTSSVEGRSHEWRSSENSVELTETGNQHEKSQAPGVLERWNHVATVRHSTLATVLQACAAVNIALASRPL